MTMLNLYSSNFTETTQKLTEVTQNPIIGFSLTKVEENYNRIKPYLQETPCIHSTIPNALDIYLKCENLQTTKSFKLRAALSNLLYLKEKEPLTWNFIKKNGVITASSGNFALAMAYACNMLHLPLTVVIHDKTAAKKKEALHKLYPSIILISISLPEWQEVMLQSRFTKSNAFFISGELSLHSLLGNASIGLEIEQFFHAKKIPSSEKRIIIPYGGGGLSVALGTFFKLLHPKNTIWTAEIPNGAPFHASYLTGRPEIVDYKSSFVDGIGASFVIPQLFYLAKEKVDHSALTSVEEICQSIALLAEYENLIVEGAGAASLSVALHSPKITETTNTPTVCILSGGNIQFEDFTSLLKKKG